MSAILVTAQETFATRCMSTPIGHFPCPHGPVPVAQSGFTFCILDFSRGHVLVASRQVQSFLNPFKSLEITGSSVCHPKATLLVAVMTYRNTTQTFHTLWLQMPSVIPLVLIYPPVLLPSLFPEQKLHVMAQCLSVTPQIQCSLKW